MRALLLSLLALAACDAPPPLVAGGDIVGPFSGNTVRFAVDEIGLPTMRADFAEDLNGDGKPDNSLGSICTAIAAQQLMTTATDDLFAAGVVAPTVEITTDDPALLEDPTVGVRFIGAPNAPADTMGAILSRGGLASNRVAATKTPAAGELHLPLLGDADPTVLPVIASEIDLSPDGAGGFSGTLRGAFPSSAMAAAFYPGFLQRILADPSTVSGDVLPYVDANNDGAIPFDEFAGNQIVQNILRPDLQLTVGGAWQPTKLATVRDSVSFAFQFHLVPCPSGSCAKKTPATQCDDRLLDGDETDLDCGGACLACPTGANCATGADCRSSFCDGGKCRAPTCSDGVRDGFETAPDCGSTCGGCLGDICGDAYVCKIGSCVMGTCT